ncbi:MAG: DUF3794 domain-containing protein [Clostridia bacterium]|nr:DUF3794 domain-containing protein [Clostridia bacterium]
MELELQKEKIGTNKKIYAGRAEHIETAEIIVPDYLPDARAVISSQARINIKDKSAADGKITINGEICFTALISADGGNIPVCASGRAPFKEVFPVPGETLKTFVKVRASLGQSEAHVINSRKIGFRAVAEIDVSAFEPESLDTVSGFSSDIHIESLKTPQSLCLFSSYGEKQFVIEEDLFLPQTKPSAKELLSYRASLFPEDVKLISNKAIIKGTAKIFVLYLGDEDESALETFESEIPFSLIADAAGVDETHEAETVFSISDVSVSMAHGQSGRTVSVSISALACVSAYRRVSLESITEAFSTTHELKLKSDDSPVLSLFETKRTPISIRDAISPPEGTVISKVLDVCGELSAFDAEYRAGEIRLSAGVDVRALCIGSDGAAFCLMRTLPVSLTVTTNAEKAEAEIVNPFFEISHNLNMSGEIEIKLHGEAVIHIFEHAPFTRISAAEATEKTGEDDSARPALFACFPEKGETVWNIAKKYSASPDDIIGANKLSCGVQSVLETSRVLLIPRTRPSEKKQKEE